MKKLSIYIILGVLASSFSATAQINMVNVPCSGTNVCLVAGAFNGNIQWQNSNDLLSWSNIPSATTDTFCFPAGSTSYYRAEVINGTCDPIYSDTTLLTVLGGGSSGVDTFFFTGAFQQFTVSGCIDSVTITCYGAQGGDVTGYSPYPIGGLGAIMSGKFNVTNGQVLTVVVGGKGNDDPSSAGGGGASGVADGATPFIVAGGGAGFDFQDPSYSGAHAVITPNGVQGNGSGGVGGTGGGDGGDVIYSGSHISRGGRGWNSGNSGSLGQDGVSASTTYTAGTFGLGGGGGSVGYGWCNCGGGGGGYSGGGSANINQSGGGGGSYNIGVNQVNTPGAHSGNGMVIISW